MSTSSDNHQPQDHFADRRGSAVGLLVFAIGIVMMVMVFWWGYRLLASIDTQIAQVRPAPAVTTPATETPESRSETALPPTVVAQPRPDLTLGQVAATIGLKLLGLAILAYVGALVAAKGAQLARAERGRN